MGDGEIIRNNSVTLTEFLWFGIIRSTSPNYFLLYRFSPNLFAAAFSGQCLFDALFFSRFQVEGVSFDFLDNVFLLNLAFESPQRVFDGFPILNTNFSQSIHPHSTST